MIRLRGGCLCGRVRYEISVLLISARSCHCSLCRKAFSGAGSAYAEVESETFAWVAGEENVVRYESSQGWGLCFCTSCGSTLCGIHGSDVHRVTLGRVDGDRASKFRCTSLWPREPHGITLAAGRRDSIPRQVEQTRVMSRGSVYGESMLYCGRKKLFARS